MYFHTYIDNGNASNLLKLNDTFLIHPKCIYLFLLGQCNKLIQSTS